ncbi:MAG: cytochrome c oxidase accessory protein CcoG [Flavobacteriales bacterium]|nr:cytochrome c oxidase accessory protein CcoG [Flavobacteriales bacterium]MCB9198290.1 cytochrome c oxidase accessory protein CcoG [Flavobacteriales bacterium]
MENEEFRDSISTVDKKGKRVWIYPKKPFGKFTNWRKNLSYLLLALLFGMPYIKIGGEPLLMLNVIEGKFVIFGQIFWPQDLFIFALAMITGIVFVTLFTLAFGRLFCGWVCPQTIFMEMVFRRIEYWIEGDWTHQKKLNDQPWTGEKIRKKVIKHILFWTLSFAIANTFLSYIIGYEELWKIILAGPFANFGGFVAISVFTTVFYAVFAFMREQVCTTVCPYGRLQGVLLDNRSLVVAYDYLRGEGRAKFKKNEDRKAEGKGDCIDCKQCIHVCPTGIDIRNGTQLECVNCTACIDACDHMMDSVGLPKGLIKFASEEGIKNKTPFQFTTRIKVYTILLFLLLGVLSTLILTRTDVQTTIMRTRGTTFAKFEEDKYSNLFDISILNKTNDDMDITLKILEGEGEIKVIGDSLHLKKQDELHSKFLLIIDKENIDAKVNFVIGVYSGEELIEKKPTIFMGPNI